MGFRQPPPDEAERHYLKALRYGDRKKREFNFKLAIQHFEQAIKLKPNNPAYHYRLERAFTAAPLLAVSRGGLIWRANSVNLQSLPSLS